MKSVGIRNLKDQLGKKLFNIDGLPTDEPHHECAEPAESDTDRREHRAQPGHRAPDDPKHPLGVLDGEHHRQDLADGG